MSRAVVVVWLGASSLRAVHEPDLISWADARQVTLEDISPDSPLPRLGHDDQLAAKVEGLIAEAHSVSDPGEATSALASAEALLRAHAELPESAWLMAEILRTRVALGVLVDAEAAAAQARAEALEGDRAARYDPAIRTGSVEQPASRPDGADSPRAGTDPPLGFGADGPLPTDDVYVDGVRDQRSTVPHGEHHYRIVRGDGLAWAGWTDAAGAAAIRVPGTSPCSSTDLGAIDDASARITLRHRVLCPEWAVARTLGDDRIEVARCHGSSCGTFLPWKREWGASFEMPVHRPWPTPKSNAWIVWTAASIAAVATTGLVLWQAGAFEKAPESQTETRIYPPGPGMGSQGAGP